MEKNLRDIFYEYKDCTLKIIDLIKADKLDSINDLVAKRGKLVDDIFKFESNKEEIKLLFDEFNLDMLQKELNSIAAEKLLNIKCEIEKINKVKTVNKIYNKSKISYAKIFSKNI